MKKRLCVIASLLLLSLMAVQQLVRAQDAMAVSIPFEFLAGRATVPAGEYSIQKLNETSAVLLIHYSDPSASVLLITNAAQAKKMQTGSKLVFNRYGNRYFLSQVWTAGSIRGRQLLKSPGEKEIAQIANIEPKTEVTLVARLTPAHRRRTPHDDSSKRTGIRSPASGFPFCFLKPWCP